MRRPSLLLTALLLSFSWPAADADARQSDRPDPPVAEEPADDPPAPADDETPDETPAPPGGPVVRSEAEAASARKSAADLLRPPGEDRYSTPIDWASLPPWQQTAFFGVRAKGTVFVFVVDCSGSMADDFRLVRAKQELRRCIGAMKFPQRYLIIFYNDRPRPMSGGMPASSDQREKQAAYSWLGSVEAEGGTDPRGAMDLAIGLEPDAIFLLSDGEFPAGTDSTIAARNAENRVPIHCIDLAGGMGAVQLKAIAEGSAGSYALRR